MPPSFNKKYDRAAILADYHAGVKPSDIAKKYGAPLRTVYAIVTDYRRKKQLEDARQEARAI